MTAIAKYVLSLLFLSGYSNCQNHDDFFRNDYVVIGSLFYKYHADLMKWDKSKVTCEDEGAMLYFPEHEEDLKDIQWIQWLEQKAIVTYMSIGAYSINGTTMTIENKKYNLPVVGPPSNHRECLFLHIPKWVKELTTIKFNCSEMGTSFICKKTKASKKWNEQCNMAVLNSKDEYDYEHSSTLKKCYKLHSVPEKWQRAKKICEAEQSALAELNSQDEADHLMKMVARVPEERVGVVCLGFELKEKGWIMSSNHKFLSESGYVMWAHTQPNGGSSEPHGAMAYNGRLHDIAKDAECIFVCERDISV